MRDGDLPLVFPTSVLAISGNRIVGKFGLKAVSPSAAELRRTYVDPDMRRRGIARMMLQAAEGECRRHSEQGLNSAPRNCRARRYSFYRSPG
jgi:GNAT superfamily N-acetyltransferase